MKKIELIAAVLIVIGIFIKILLIAGGDMILTISMSLLAVLYYPFGFFLLNSIPINKIFKKDSYKGMTFFRGLGAFGGGVIFSVLTIGSLFKLLQLPGAGLMLTVGLTAGTLFLVITSIKYFMHKESAFLRKMLVRSVTIIGLSGILMAVPGLTLVKIFFRNNPEYIKAYEQVQKNPDDKKLKLKVEKARERR